MAIAMSSTNSIGQMSVGQMFFDQKTANVEFVFFQDFWYLRDGVDDDAESKELELAHYLYPVDVKSVLANDELKNIICRNLGG
jgi:hypothetical protein